MPYTLKLQSWNSNEILKSYELSTEIPPSFPANIAFLVDGSTYTPLRYQYDITNQTIIALINNDSDEYYSSLRSGEEITLDNGLIFATRTSTLKNYKSWNPIGSNDHR